MAAAHELLTGIALLAVGIIYGTDVFCALVQRSALGRVDDETLTKVMGFVHLYGDKRLSVPGALSVVATVLTAITAVPTGNATAIVAGIAAVLLMACWFGVYLRVSVPVNKQLTEAAESGYTSADARALQEKWDSVINWRAGLQCLTLTALFVGGAAG
ncbi:DUF1772 domain-containing protein [Streptomyces sp. 7N604]|uniref:DUF1772 domain-containing protein n=1 Tax=Streptomyces sp. 7N604 TaxID=3457415 RepID=UPI003FD5B788